MKSHVADTRALENDAIPDDSAIVCLNNLVNYTSKPVAEYKHAQTPHSSEHRGQLIKLSLEIGYFLKIVLHIDR